LRVGSHAPLTDLCQFDILHLSLVERGGAL